MRSAADIKPNERETFLIGLQFDEVKQLWGEIRPLIEKPLVRTGAIEDYLPEDILDRIENRDMQCWIVHDRYRIVVVAITEILVYPRRKLIAVPFVGAIPGHIDQWLHHVETIKEFGRAEGCSAGRGWGRKGWEKVMGGVKNVRVEFDFEV